MKPMYGDTHVSSLRDSGIIGGYAVATHISPLAGLALCLNLQGIKQERITTQLSLGLSLSIELGVVQGDSFTFLQIQPKSRRDETWVATG